MPELLLSKLGEEVEEKDPELVRQVYAQATALAARLPAERTAPRPVRATRRAPCVRRGRGADTSRVLAFSRGLL